MDKFTPYIGITDFMNFAQVEQMIAVFRAHQSPLSDRQLHVGVMMSYKTLNGIATKWSKAFPHPIEIEGIFASRDTFNCLHYADYDNSKNYYLDLALALSYCGKHLDGVQLDMVWPDPDDIHKALEADGKYPQVILQVGKNAIEACGNDPGRVVARLKPYEGVIDRVLLDKSMGKGLGMDAVGLLPYARAIRDAFPDISIGAAGGLGPDTMDLVLPLLEEFPDLSIDAQGKLRPSGNALDPIDWDMASRYLERALACMQ